MGDGDGQKEIKVVRIRALIFIIMALLFNINRNS